MQLHMLLRLRRHGRIPTAGAPRRKRARRGTKNAGMLPTERSACRRSNHRALRKIGAMQEGILRQSFLRNGEYLD